MRAAMHAPMKHTDHTLCHARFWLATIALANT
jgi:hypothetical protein